MKKPAIFLFAILFWQSSAVMGQMDLQVGSSCILEKGKTIFISVPPNEAKNLFQEVFASSKLEIEVQFIFSEDVTPIAAFQADGKNYLALYSNYFYLKKINEQGIKEMKLLLAHQLFYLASQVSMADVSVCQDLCLEADRYLGYYLNENGIALPEAKNQMAAALKNDWIKAGPPVSERLIALENGWKSAEEMKESNLDFSASSDLKIPPIPELANSKSLRLDEHVILWGSNFPILAETWNSGFQIKEANYAYGTWRVVMVRKQGDFVSQAMRLRAEFPEEEIKELWADKFDITNVSFLDGVWYFCFIKLQTEEVQRWRTNPEFPLTELEENAKEGYYIVDMDYGNGIYTLILNQKKKDFLFQKWFRSNVFPEAEINNLWTQHYRISCLKKINGEWFLVMTRFRKNENQKLFREREYPFEIIRAQEKLGFRVRLITFADGLWNLIMDKTPDSQ